MKETSFLYVDEKRFVTYANDVDSAYNKRYTKWQRFVMPSALVPLFMKYWQLRFHPLTLKNVVK